MQLDECFQLGYVIRKHGLNGEVNIFLDVDFPYDYKDLESVFVEINKKLVPFFIGNISIKGNKAVVNFDDVNSIEKAEELVGKTLYLPMSALPELQDGQFYFHEIIDYKVIDSVNGEIGTVLTVYSTSQQDLLVVSVNGKEALIPINDEIISHVDRNSKAIHVTLPDGLLEIYME